MKEKKKDMVLEEKKKTMNCELFNVLHLPLSIFLY